MEDIRSYRDLATHVGRFLPLIHSGKVRDSFRLPEGADGEKRRLVLVSDRASIYDFKLPFEVPGKGEILNAFNIASRLLIREAMSNLEDDMVAFGADIDGYLQNDGLEGDPMLQKCAVVVRELPMIPRECVVRGHLTGYAYKANKAGKLVCGHDIGMRDMQEGTILMPPIFTPTTKAESGHDLPLDYREVENEYPGLGGLSVRIFEFFYQRARERGIVIADTKFEFGYRKQAVPRRTIYILADEVFTPDSSRFWDIQELDWALIRKRLPPSLDKQALRDWGKEIGIDKLDPENPGDLEFVASLRAPEKVIHKMLQRMQDAFLRLYGSNISIFQKSKMGVRN